jgi:hypothetical protein
MSGFQEERSNLIPYFFRDCTLRAVTIDQPEALRFTPRELMISRANLVMKFDRLFIDAGLATIVIAPISRVRTRQSSFRVDIDAQRQVRNQTVTCDPIDFEHRLPTQAASRSLIGDG